jgi:hypothetical protein
MVAIEDLAAGSATLERHERKMVTGLSDGTEEGP